MTAQLDLFLEKIFARMNLDDIQRAEVEREFRSHLEEAIEQAQRAGLTREQAENEAMVRFGQPSVVARQFGALHATAWFVFEKAAFVFVLFGLMALHLPTSAAFLCAALVLTMELWRKVEVNGVLRVRRFLRPTVAIPFTAIRDVSFQRGHLFGARSICVAYDGGQVTFSSRTRGARCAGLALSVLAPQAVRPEVAAFLQRLRLRLRREGAVMRCVLTAFWLAVLGMCGVAFMPLWRIEGLPFLTLGACAAACLLSIVQGQWHADHGKRGLCWIFLAGLPILAFWAVYVWGLGSPRSTRWLALAFPLIMLLPVLTLWWKGRRSMLLAWSAAMIGVALAAQLLVPPVWTGCIRSLALQPFFRPSQAYWSASDSGEPAYVSLLSPRSKADSYRYINANARRTVVTTLVEGNWAILGKPSSGTVSLLYSEQVHDDAPGKSELYDVTPKGGLQRVERLPADCSWGYMSIIDVPSWSPDSSYLVTPVRLVPPKPCRRELAVTHIPTGTLHRFDGFTPRDVWRWRDSRRLQVVRERPTQALQGTTNGAVTREESSEYEVWTLDAATGEKTLERRLCFGEGAYRLYLWRYGRYALLAGNDAGQCGIGDLETGEMVKLPEQDGDPASFGHAMPEWDYTNGRVAYVTVSENGCRRILVAGPKGVIASAPLPPKADIQTISLAPDGTKVMLANKVSPPFGLGGLVHILIFDVARLKMVTIDRLNVYQSTLSFFTASTPRSAIRWTPDSRSVVYPINDILLNGASYKQGTDIRVADYEQWAEGMHPE